VSAKTRRKNKILMHAHPLGLRHPILKAAFAYWQSKSPDGALPSLQHIDPVEMKSFLANLVLLDVIRDGDRLRYRHRVAGSVMTDAMDEELTGKFFSDDERLAPHRARLDALVKTGQPYYHYDSLTAPRREHVKVHRIALPLARDGSNVDMILGCMVAEPESIDFRRFISA
jgi:hypothetical protein